MKQEYVEIDHLVLNHPLKQEVESDITLIEFVEPIDIPNQPVIEVL